MHGRPKTCHSGLHLTHCHNKPVQRPHASEISATSNPQKLLRRIPARIDITVQRAMNHLFI